MTSKSMNIIANYYRKLGLNLGASLGEVKASYRRLARIYHPDVNPKDQQAKDKFIAVTEAYKILLMVAPTQTESVYNSTLTSTTNKKSKSETVYSKTVAPKETKVRVNFKQEQGQKVLRRPESNKRCLNNIS